MAIDVTNLSGVATASLAARDVVAPPQAPVPAEGVLQSSAVPPPGETQKKVDPEVLEQSVAKLEQHMQSIKRQIQFEVDDSSGKTIVRVLDPDSGDLIRQVPAEEVVATAAALAEVADIGASSTAGGLLLKDQA